MSITTLFVFVCISLGLPTDDAPTSASQPPGFGSITGRISYDGPLPPAVLNPEAGTRRSPVEVDPQTRGLREAAVWLVDVPSTDELLATHAEPEDDEPIEVDQVNFEFIPHVLTVEAGRPVAFLNNDVANHGVTATGSAVENRFNVTTPPGGRHVHRFVPSRQPVALGCPIHVAMSGWIFVFDHPYHTVTDDLGRFQLDQVPAGQHTLLVHHPDGGFRRRITVNVREGETTELEIRFVEDDLRLRSGTS